MRTRGVAALFSSAALCVLFSFVHTAHADTSVRVAQILPPQPQAQTCPVLGTTDVTPFIYDGALHSFDISITDSAYVALSAQVGDATVPFTQFSRWFDGHTGVRLHVDVAAIPLTRDTPIQITLVAPHVGAQGATCVATLSTVVKAVSQPEPTRPTGQGTGGYPTAHTPAYVAPQYPWSHISYQGHVSSTSAHQNNTSTAAATSVATSTNTNGAGVVTATHALGGACTIAGGPTRLWVILLVLYAIFAWLLASRVFVAERNSRDWNVALVVAGFLALLFFWYISAACRTGSWAPILATIIACAGLIALTQSPAVAEGETLLLQKEKQPDLIAQKGGSRV